MKPYSELYKADKSKNKEQSSKDIWVIVLLTDPSPENIFYRMKVEERVEMLKETYNKKFNLDDKLTKLCYDSFPNDNLDSVEKAFKDEIDSLVKRSIFLSAAEYTFDDVERDAKGAPIFIAGKPMVKKGTANDIDKMRANTQKIFLLVLMPFSYFI